MTVKARGIGDNYNLLNIHFIYLSLQPSTAGDISSGGSDDETRARSQRLKDAADSDRLRTESEVDKKVRNRNPSRVLSCIRTCSTFSLELQIFLST